MDLAPVIKQRFFDADGAPLALGKLYTYAAGTADPLATYTTQDGGTPNLNPVILDADGWCNLWLQAASYKFILKDALDNLIFTVDHVNSPAQGQLVLTGPFTITDGQVATDVSGEVFDSDVVTSVEYLAEIRRGTELVANVRMVLQWQDDDSLWAVYLGEAIGDGKLHGLTFSMSTIGTQGQLLVSADSVYGNGTLKLKKVINAAI